MGDGVGGGNNTSVNILHLYTGDNKFAFSNQKKADALNSIFIPPFRT